MEERTREREDTSESALWSNASTTERIRGEEGVDGDGRRCELGGDGVVVRDGQREAGGRVQGRVTDGVDSGRRRRDGGLGGVAVVFMAVALGCGGGGEEEDNDGYKIRCY